MISSGIYAEFGSDNWMFQSRNRGSFDFKKAQIKVLDEEIQRLFQSRNRGSFDFKGKSLCR